MGKCVGMWGVKGSVERCGEVCLGCGDRCGKCVGVGGVGRVGKYEEVWKMWGGEWKCVWGVGRCGKGCLGVGNVLG